MNDLISRSALIEALKEDKKSLFSQVFCYVEPTMQFDVMNNLERLINNQPTVATPLSDCVGDCKNCWKTKLVNKPTVEPVRGEWQVATQKGVYTWSKGYARCSACEETVWGGWDMNFCPNCGADMRGEKND